ncbi:hypothetical protein [Sulfobacillus harzensis]|uniref:Uncharacterized protein n=1 Tax=Sulfobacillus harzensis TaxID=2729629 RepID=A0A7Y0L518_9FIRM|nr:hypothetical protein [Sulfobacillus harzensis]NMP23335.1 hypothetical protein [Sulfobacillus harzensis]
MHLAEAIKNQIIYLQYVLDGVQESVDAEVLRPIEGPLRLAQGELSGEARSTCLRLQRQISHWLDLGLSLSRPTVERVLEGLKSLYAATSPPSPLAG